MKLPHYSVRTRKLEGAPYTAHTIVLADGRVVHSQLGPYGAGEAAARVRAFMEPAAIVPSPKFVPYSAARPGRPKGRRGEAWRDHSWLPGQEPDA